MAARQRMAAVVAVGGMAVLVGCGSTSSTSATTSAGGQTSGSATMQTVTQPVTTTGTTSVSTAVQNLAVTSALRAELLKAGAAVHDLPVSDFTGLAPGRTYYAYDPTTSTYWAGAALVPSTSSTPAQISVQDDGSYLLFTRQPGGSWAVYSVGMTLIPGGKCPVVVPSPVLSVWGWAPGTCRPAA